MFPKQPDVTFSVLLVEADPAISQGLKLQIEVLPAFVVVAILATAAAATDLTTRTRFDIAVVDEHLADMDGAELCRRLHGRGVRHCILHARSLIDPNSLPSDGVSAIVLRQLSGSDLIRTLERLVST